MFSCTQKDNGNEKSADMQEVSNYTGTYYITDERGFKWTILLTPDKTVVAQCDGKIHYGSWGNTLVLTKEKFNAPGMNFSFDEQPYLYFPSGKEDLDHAMFSEDGYIYSSVYDYRAKNSRKRLKYTK